MIRLRFIVLSLKEYFNPGSITLFSGVRHSISGNGLKYELSYNIYIFHFILEISLQDIYICKTQIDVQPLIDIQSSNPCLISVIDICTSDLCPFSNSQIYVRFSLSQIDVCSKL